MIRRLSAGFNVYTNHVLASRIVFELILIEKGLHAKYRPQLLTSVDQELYSRSELDHTPASPQKSCTFS